MKNFSVIYEDANVLVIDKPSGIMVHEDGRATEETIADIFARLYPESKGVGDEGRPGIVHRLDRNTTGVLILAKNQPTFLYLKRQFKEHQTRKVYRAIVEGRMKDETGMISAPLARAKSDFRKRTAVDMFSQDARGEERESLTRYKVIGQNEGDPRLSYVEAYPLTGRTHQIRAHFRHIRHPIIGDDLYGSKSGKDLAGRSMLHSRSLTISLPGEGSKTFEAPLPKDMKEALEKYGFSC